MVTIRNRKLITPRSKRVNLGRNQSLKKSIPVVVPSKSKRAKIISSKPGNKNFRRLLEQVSETNKQYLQTGISGFDALLERGIPQYNSILVAGGAGSGKTIFCLQTVYNLASHGKKCLYLSFEESEQRLLEHMKDFGWDTKPLIAKNNLKIVRKNSFTLSNNLEALLAHAKGELLININDILEIIPPGFIPELIVVDSLNAIAAGFLGSEEGYRIFIEQLFRYFESLGVTSLFISETEQVPQRYSASGVEEFLADGVIVLYAIKRGNIRENAIEVLKMRRGKHHKKVVAMQILETGIEVYPEQEVFGEIN